MLQSNEIQELKWNTKLNASVCKGLKVIAMVVGPAKHSKSHYPQMEKWKNSGEPF